MRHFWWIPERAAWAEFVAWWQPQDAGKDTTAAEGVGSEASARKSVCYCRWTVGKRSVPPVSGLSGVD